jgi:hypothetical protein
VREKEFVMKNASWINTVLGAWLLIAPFALSTVVANVAWTANDIALGILLMAASAVVSSAASPSFGVAWFEVFCGIWLIVAPFVLRYANRPVKLGNDVISGFVVIIVTAIAMSTTRRPWPYMPANVLALFRHRFHHFAADE